jgi:hypothetical protein
MEQGYVKAPHAIVRDPSLSAVAKVAWLLIAGMPDGYHPTRDQWMTWLNIRDKRVWFRIIKELDAAALIEVETCGGRRYYKAKQIGAENAPIQVRNPHPDGCVKRTALGEESAPHKKNIEEQEKNISEARVRLREDVMVDMMVETGCRSVGITQQQYIQFAQEIFSDWEFSDLPDNEWNKHHFLSVLRIKAKEHKRNATEKDRQPIAAGRAERATRLAATMAALATKGDGVETKPW